MKPTTHTAFRPHRRNVARAFLPKRLVFVLLGIAAYLTTLYAQRHPDWTEQAYSHVAYPVLSSIAGFLPSLVRFSVAEWVALLFVLFCLWYVVHVVRAIVKGGRAAAMRPDTAGPSCEAAGEAPHAAGEPCGAEVGAGRAASTRPYGRGVMLYRGVVGALAIACVSYAAFTALCGLNYYRLPFSSHLGYDVEQSSVEELEGLCASLADGLGQARAEIGEGVDLATSAGADFDRYAQSAVAATARLAEQYPVLDRPFYSEPKPVLASGLMSDAGIAGMFFPFTMESNINDDIPLFTLPSTMAHELAHQCGFMREDEANFIAYLTCKQSDDPLMRYSGLYLAFSHSLSALWRVDPQAASALRASLPEAVQRDIEGNARFWAQHEGAVSDASQAMNDAYLKANNQADGVSSYGRMVDLLLAEQRAAA